MRRVPVLLALLAAVLPAGALTIQPVPFADLIDGAKSIVLGKVVAARSEVYAPNGRIYTYYTVAVESDDKLPGDATPAAQVVVRMLGGTVGDKSLLVEGQKMLSLGEEVYLFLEEDTLNKQDYRIMGMVQGHFEVVKNERTGLRQAKGMAPDLAAVDATTRREFRAKGGIDVSANVPSEADFQELRAAVRQQVLRAQNPRYQAMKKQRQSGAAGTGAGQRQK